MSTMTTDAPTLAEWHEAFAEAQTTVLILRMHDPIGALDKAIEYRDSLLEQRFAVATGG